MANKKLDSKQKETQHKLNILKQINDEKKKKKSREDVNEFIEYVMIDEMGNYFKQSHIHRRWHKFIRKCWDAQKNPAILAPWGAGKSRQIAIGMTLFELGRNPNLRVKIVCNSDENAKKRVTSLKNYIEKSDRIKKVYPKLVPSYDHWTDHSFNISGRLYSEVDHSVEACGVESRIIGGRADLLIFDDIVDNKSEQSPAYRQMTKDNLENVFMSRLEPSGRIGLIGTMWHRDDAHCFLIGKQSWKFMIQGVSDDFECIEEIIV
ncbi:MAG: hypothetical protein GF364_03340 [Candidatus Lokiarchaeota archaeon]|nr:hypothetical protein [Candidatus Lokiarchaeota archaeon]